MRYFEARDVRNSAGWVAVGAFLVGTIMGTVNYLLDSHMSQAGTFAVSCSALVTVVASVVWFKERRQMTDYESDLHAVGGTD